MPTLKNTGVRNRFESMPQRPVDSEGYITSQYLAQSRGEAQVLARKLMRIESRRYPSDRRYGEKFDKLLQQQRINTERLTSQFATEQSQLIEDFGSSLDINAKDMLKSQPRRKFRDLKTRQKKICNRETLINCILDTTVITVEPRRNGDFDSTTMPPRASEWDPESVAIAQTPGYGSTCSGSGSPAH